MATMTMPMSSRVVRDMMPEDLPAVHMPACDTRKVLKGQKALVTGANSGIGKAIAIALCQAGADVVINYRNGDDAARAVAEEGGMPSVAWAGERNPKDPVRVSIETRFHDFTYLLELGLVANPGQTVFYRDPEVKRERIALAGASKRAVVVMEREGPSAWLREPPNMFSPARLNSLPTPLAALPSVSTGSNWKGIGSGCPASRR